MAFPTAIGLIRVSTPDQRLGLDAQRAAIQKFAADHGIDVLSIHEEIASGGAEFHERVVLRAACEEIARRGAKHLIVAKRDRIAREPMVTLLVEKGLEQLKASVLAADGNNGLDPASELVRHILDAVAQFERAMIGIRTKAALAQARENGTRLGRPPGVIGKTRSDKGVKRDVLAESKELLALADWRHLVPRPMPAERKKRDPSTYSPKWTRLSKPPV